MAHDALLQTIALEGTQKLLLKGVSVPESAVTAADTSLFHANDDRAGIIWVAGFSDDRLIELCPGQAAG